MTTATFEGAVLLGHKEAAIEVPFDPAVRWHLPLTRLQAGRWGHRVEGRVNGLRFETAIVPRASSFFLLLPPDLLKAAGLEVGATIHVSVHPKSSGPAPAPPADPTAPAKPARARRSTKEKRRGI